MSKEAEKIIREFNSLPESPEKYILLGQIKSLVEAEKVAAKAKEA